MKEILTYYCDYNIWANQKLADFFADKSEELLSRPIENSFPSIRKTALHILSAETGWLARLSQDPKNNKRVEDNFNSTQQVFEALVETSKRFSQFVKNQPDSFFELPIGYKTWVSLCHHMLDFLKAFIN